MTSGIQVLTISTQGLTHVDTWTPSGSGGILAYLQEAVDGSVDVIALTPDLDMWVNDEFLVNGMSPNPLATAIARLAGWTGHQVCGPVVLTGGVDEVGNTQSLDPTLTRSLD